MSDSSLFNEMECSQIAQAVDDCLKIISDLALDHHSDPTAPTAVATVVGNIVSNVAGICAVQGGVHHGAEIHAAINSISSKSVDMFLREHNMDVDAYHDFYMRCLVTIAGSFKKGILIKPTGEKKQDESIK